MWAEVRSTASVDVHWGRGGIKPWVEPFWMVSTVRRVAEQEESTDCRDDKMWLPPFPYIVIFQE